MAIAIDGPATGLAADCAPILAALPDWFGLPEANAAYLRDLATLPTWLARRDGRPVGFLAVRCHAPASAELHVMGVLPAAHRRGIGRRLVAAAEAALRADRVALFQVKTLGPSHPSAPYARTRAFYAALGFLPLEETTALWGPSNPCLIMVEPLR